MLSPRNPESDKSAGAPDQDQESAIMRSPRTLVRSPRILQAQPTGHGHDDDDPTFSSSNSETEKNFLARPSGEGGEGGKNENPRPRQESSFFVKQADAEALEKRIMQHFYDLQAHVETQQMLQMKIVQRQTEEGNKLDEATTRLAEYEAQWEERGFDREAITRTEFLEHVDSIVKPQIAAVIQDCSNMEEKIALVQADVATEVMPLCKLNKGDIEAMGIRVDANAKQVGDTAAEVVGTRQEIRALGKSCAATAAREAINRATANATVAMLQQWQVTAEQRLAAVESTSSKSSSVRPGATTALSEEVQNMLQEKDQLEGGLQLEGASTSTSEILVARECTRKSRASVFGPKKSRRSSAAAMAAHRDESTTAALVDIAQDRRSARFKADGQGEAFRDDVGDAVASSLTETGAAPGAAGEVINTGGTLKNDASSPRTTAIFSSEEMKSRRSSMAEARATGASSTGAANVVSTDNYMLPPQQPFLDAKQLEAFTLPLLEDLESRLRLEFAEQVRENASASVEEVFRAKLDAEVCPNQEALRQQLEEAVTSASRDRREIERRLTEETQASQTRSQAFKDDLANVVERVNNSETQILALVEKVSKIVDHDDVGVADGGGAHAHAVARRTTTDRHTHTEHTGLLGAVDEAVPEYPTTSVDSFVVDQKDEHGGANKKNSTISTLGESRVSSSSTSGPAATLQDEEQVKDGSTSRRTQSVQRDEVSRSASMSLSSSSHEPTSEPRKVERASRRPSGAAESMSRELHQARQDLQDLRSRASSRETKKQNAASTVDDETEVLLEEGPPVRGGTAVMAPVPEQDAQGISIETTRGASIRASAAQSSLGILRLNDRYPTRMSTGGDGGVDSSTKKSVQFSGASNSLLQAFPHDENANGHIDFLNSNNVNNRSSVQVCSKDDLALVEKHLESDLVNCEKDMHALRTRVLALEMTTRDSLAVKVQQLETQLGEQKRRNNTIVQDLAAIRLSVDATSNAPALGVGEIETSRTTLQSRATSLAPPVLLETTALVQQGQVSRTRVSGENSGLEQVGRVPQSLASSIERHKTSVIATSGPTPRSALEESAAVLPLEALADVAANRSTAVLEKVRGAELLGAPASCNSDDLLRAKASGKQTPSFVDSRQFLLLRSAVLGLAATVEKNGEKLRTLSANPRLQLGTAPTTAEPSEDGDSSVSSSSEKGSFHASHDDIGDLSRFDDVASDEQDALVEDKNDAITGTSASSVSSFLLQESKYNKASTSLHKLRTKDESTEEFDAFLKATEEMHKSLAERLQHLERAQEEFAEREREVSRKISLIPAHLTTSTRGAGGSSLSLPPAAGGSQQQLLTQTQEPSSISSPDPLGRAVEMSLREAGTMSTSSTTSVINYVEEVSTVAAVLVDDKVEKMSKSIRLDLWNTLQEMNLAMNEKLQAMLSEGADLRSSEASTVSRNTSSREQGRDDIIGQAPAEGKRSVRFSEADHAVSLENAETLAAGEMSSKDGDGATSSSLRVVASSTSSPAGLTTTEEPRDSATRERGKNKKLSKKLSMQLSPRALSRAKTGISSDRILRDTRTVLSTDVEEQVAALTTRLAELEKQLMAASSSMQRSSSQQREKDIEYTRGSTTSASASIGGDALGGCLTITNKKDDNDKLLKKMYTGTLQSTSPRESSRVFASSVAADEHDPDGVEWSPKLTMIANESTRTSSTSTKQDDNNAAVEDDAPNSADAGDTPDLAAVLTSIELQQRRADEALLRLQSELASIVRRQESSADEIEEKLQNRIDTLHGDLQAAELRLLDRISENTSGVALLSSESKAARREQMKENDVLVLGGEERVKDILAAELERSLVDVRAQLDARLASEVAKLDAKKTQTFLKAVDEKIAIAGQKLGDQLPVVVSTPPISSSETNEAPMRPSSSTANLSASAAKENQISTRLELLQNQTSSLETRLAAQEEQHRALDAKHSVQLETISQLLEAQQTVQQEQVGLMQRNLQQLTSLEPREGQRETSLFEQLSRSQGSAFDPSSGTQGSVFDPLSRTQGSAFVPTAEQAEPVKITTPAVLATSGITAGTAASSGSSASKATATGKNDNKTPEEPDADAQNDQNTPLISSSPSNRPPSVRFRKSREELMAAAGLSPTVPKRSSTSSTTRTRSQSELPVNKRSSGSASRASITTLLNSSARSKSISLNAGSAVEEQTLKTSAVHLVNADRAETSSTTTEMSGNKTESIFAQAKASVANELQDVQRRIDSKTAPLEDGDALRGPSGGGPDLVLAQREEVEKLVEDRFLTLSADLTSNVARIVDDLLVAFSANIGETMTTDDYQRSSGTGVVSFAPTAEIRQLNADSGDSGSGEDLSSPSQPPRPGSGNMIPPQVSEDAQVLGRTTPDPDFSARTSSSTNRVVSVSKNRRSNSADFLGRRTRQSSLHLPSAPALSDFDLEDIMDELEGSLRLQSLVDHKVGQIVRNILPPLVRDLVMIGLTSAAVDEERRKEGQGEGEGEQQNQTSTSRTSRSTGTSKITSTSPIPINDLREPTKNEREPTTVLSTSPTSQHFLPATSAGVPNGTVIREVVVREVEAALNARKEQILFSKEQQQRGSSSLFLSQPTRQAPKELELHTDQVVGTSSPSTTAPSGALGPAPNGVVDQRRLAEDLRLELGAELKELRQDLKSQIAKDLQQRFHQMELEIKTATSLRNNASSPSNTNFVADADIIGNATSKLSGADNADMIGNKVDHIHKEHQQLRQRVDFLDSSRGMLREEVGQLRKEVLGLQGRVGEILASSVLGSLGGGTKNSNTSSAPFAGAAGTSRSGSRSSSKKNVAFSPEDGTSGGAEGATTGVDSVIFDGGEGSSSSMTSMAQQMEEIRNLREREQHAAKMIEQPLSLMDKDNAISRTNINEPQQGVRSTTTAPAEKKSTPVGALHVHHTSSSSLEQAPRGENEPARSSSSSKKPHGPLNVHHEGTHLEENAETSSSAEETHYFWELLPASTTTGVVEQIPAETMDWIHEQTRATSTQQSSKKTKPVVQHHFLKADASARLGEMLDRAASMKELENEPLLNGSAGAQPGDTRSRYMFFNDMQQRLYKEEDDDEQPAGTRVVNSLEDVDQQAEVQVQKKQKGGIDEMSASSMSSRGGDTNTCEESKNEINTIKTESGERGEKKEHTYRSSEKKEHTYHLRNDEAPENIYQRVPVELHRDEVENKKIVAPLQLADMVTSDHHPLPVRPPEEDTRTRDPHNADSSNNGDSHNVVVGTPSPPKKRRHRFFTAL
ncbi:unnamed protein product [Amoebophrya sp. A25]|nr:unnamed protein product [Amoebophrya sp. A25]|eukprot:GSA25T00006413001.1